MHIHQLFVKVSAQHILNFKNCLLALFMILTSIELWYFKAEKLFQGKSFNLNKLNFVFSAVKKKLICVWLFYNILHYLYWNCLIFILSRPHQNFWLTTRSHRDQKFWITCSQWVIVITCLLWFCAMFSLWLLLHCLYGHSECVMLLHGDYDHKWWES